MDDLLTSFGSVEVTSHPNTPHAEHPRFALYKAKVSGSCQEERRKKVLEARKEARYDLLSHLRSIEETDLSFGDSTDDMEYDQERVHYRRPRKYRDFLMLSEWLVDIPDNFGSTYYTVPCPVGKRSLVVSARGKTRSYTKSGYQVNQFPSLLPGGSRRNNSMGYALLDCIWSEINKTFYVIDIMCWSNQPVIECDTLFRFEWLKSRFEETTGLGEISKYNPNRFERVPYYESSPETISKIFGEGGQLPFCVELDGILFYNRETHYTHGPTPLVGWLKAYMLPEILGVPVAEKYGKERPAKYVNLPTHIEYAKELKKEKKEKMDVMQLQDDTFKDTPKSDNSEEMESGNS